MRNKYLYLVYFLLLLNLVIIFSVNVNHTIQENSGLAAIVRVPWWTNALALMEVLGLIVLGIYMTRLRRRSEATTSEAQQVSAYNRLLIDATLDPLTTIGPDGKIMDVNKATEVITGRTRSELLGSDFAQYFTDEDKARSGFKEVYARGFVRDYPLTLRSKTGGLTDVLYNATLFKVGNGEIEGVFAAARDITRIKRAEESIKRISIYNRNLIEANLDPLVTIGPDGKITDVNRATETITGFGRYELIGSDFSNYFTDPSGARNGYRQVFETGYVINYPLELRHKDGHVTPVLYNASVYRDESGKVIGVFAAARDISDRKKAEEEIKKHSKDLEDTQKALLGVMEDLSFQKSGLEEAKAKDEAIFTSIGDGLFVVDLKGGIILVNDAFEKITGWVRDECLGKDLVDLIPFENAQGEVIERNERPMIIAIKTGKEIFQNGVDSEIFIVRKDGGKVPIAYKITPVILEGKTIGAVGVFRDITSEIEITKSKSEFASLASHQLRTPLGVIKWYLETIKDDSYVKNAPAMVGDYLNEVYKSNERLIDLVRSLLSVSRIDQGRVKHSPEKVDVPGLLREIIKEMSVIAKDRNVTINLSVDPATMPEIYIDRSHLREVVSNLVANAIEYNVDGGSVDIWTYLSDGLGKPYDTLHISVKDTGIGLSKEDKEKIFSKFFRSANAVSKNPDGTGLGLYVVKSYVDGWSGKVTVVSQENIGSTFEISIPLKDKMTMDQEGVIRT